MVVKASPSSRRAWIEILPPPLWSLSGQTSPSSRRAWIEIRGGLAHIQCRLVALLAEGVDRNLVAGDSDHLLSVALLAEGVDRNVPCDKIGQVKEGSPSSRRAWIEIKLILKSSVLGMRRPPRGGRG